MPIGCGLSGSLVRINKHDMSSIPEINPALARAALANPIRLKRLLSIIGWIMEPRDEPEATTVMAKLRRLRK